MKNTSMIKKTLLGALGAVILLCVSSYVLNQPPSIEYLKEHPKEFRFENYRGRAQIEEVVNQLFPIGTPEQEIDEFFVNKLGLEKSVPWHRAKSDSQLGGATVVARPAADHFYTYYFKRNISGDSRLGQYLQFKYNQDSNRTDKVLYSTVTLIKGHGQEVLFVMGVTKREDK